jgi:hypothetical protein
MPYTHRKVGNKQCVFKKEDGKKMGCTSGSIEKYLRALHANADESIENQETITEMKGGLADGMSIKDIAKKHNLALSKINHQIAMGKKVEKEHTDNSTVAKEIAMDHLVEIPDYYTRLAAMEKKAKKSEDVETNENVKQLIKRLVRENIGLYTIDESPDATTFHILDNHVKVGTVAVGKMEKNFGKDTMELLMIYFGKDTNHLELAQDTIVTLFERFPSINRIMLQPKQQSVDFWSKLDAQRVNSKYMVIFRGH